MISIWIAITATCHYCHNIAQPCGNISLTRDVASPCNHRAIILNGKTVIISSRNAYYVDWHGAGVFPCADGRFRFRFARASAFSGWAAIPDRNGEKFDVIIVDVPDPQTAQLNRFYTVEFFLAARAHLAPGGLLALELRSSEETISPDLADFLRCIRKTLGEVFPYQAAIPGETIHFFGAMQKDALTSDPQVLVERLRERHLNTQYVREYFIPYRMMPDRMDQVETELRPAAATPVNRDFAPAAYAFDVVLWSAQFRSAQFRSGYAEWFRAAEHVTFRRVAGVTALLVAVAVALLSFCRAASGENARLQAPVWRPRDSR